MQIQTVFEFAVEKRDQLPKIRQLISSLHITSNIHVYDRFVKFLLATDLSRFLSQRKSILAQILKGEFSLFKSFSLTLIERGITFFEHREIGRLFQDGGCRLKRACEGVHTGNVC